MLRSQILQQLIQRLILGHWTTTAKNMKQHCKLHKLPATFPDYGILHHLQHGVALPASEELLILCVFAALIPITFALLDALLWQID
jgi:hypothetical protein